MCTLIVLYRPNHAWPMLIAANRDEMLDRPWLPPGRHWPERPSVIGGLDKLAGGSWFGLNDFGVAAGIMNRRETLGPLPGKRSRGELVLKAPAPDPDRDDWAAWERLLASRESAEGAEGAMNIVTDFGFGTVSSLLLALPAHNRVDAKPRLRFAACNPDQTPYRNVSF
jgi:uncharacterized protein with NRDE domain